MKKYILFIIGLVILFPVSSCTSDDEPEETENGGNNGNSTESNDLGDIDITNEEILIVFYSRTGENYPNNTWLTTGRTATMASYIQAYTGGVIYEIVPEVSYPDSYDEMRTVSQREIAEDARPAIRVPLEDLDKYSTVFVGSPIWYSRPPMIMHTFYETYDLSGKTIIPFGTHEGSGIQSCAALVNQYFPNATILESYGVRGQNITGAQEEINNWLRRIGVPQKSE